MMVVSIAVSERKGTRKTTVTQAELIENFGIRGDAHAGNWHRQVSFLAAESIGRAKASGMDVGFGDFAENIATRGIDWLAIKPGTRLRIGPRAVVEVTQIGKKCHRKCDIYHQTGDCIMPREGIFARVVKGGMIHYEDPIRIVFNPDGDAD